MLWFWIWLLFIFFLFLIPLWYGWGYKKWGPPYPWAYRRYRARGTTAAQLAPEQRGWGWAADLLWVILFLAVAWVVAGLFLA